MKVIFLDFDGVIHDARDNSILVDSNCVEILKEIVEQTGAKIVVTSSRKNDFVKFDKNSEYDFYSERFVLPLESMGVWIYDCTPCLDTEDRFSRKEKEIELYLKQHREVEEFVILDDDEIMEKFIEHQVFIEYSNGLQVEHIKPSVAILNGQLGFYPPFYDRTETLEERTKRLLGASPFLDEFSKEEMENFDRILSRVKDLDKM